MQFIKRIRNRFLVWKYPYLKPRTFDGKVIPNYKYDFTDLDCYPSGWLKIIKKYLNELNVILKEYGELDNFFITDAKEKWGSARLYFGGITNDECNEKVTKLITEMELETEKTCSWCGKKAEYRSTGYILPFCGKCSHVQKCLLHFEKIEDQNETNDN